MWKNYKEIIDKGYKVPLSRRMSKLRTDYNLRTGILIIINFNLLYTTIVVKFVGSYCLDLLSVNNLKHF